MRTPVDVIEVRIWNERVGAVSLNPASRFYGFEYDPKWLRRGIELAPITMPLSRGRAAFHFPGLSVVTYHRLPAMLADALPDTFGNALMDAALVDAGVAKKDITPLDRLAYMADRGMGALEFRPLHSPRQRSAATLKPSLFVEGCFEDDFEIEAIIRSITQEWASYNGSRFNVFIAWNPNTGEIRSDRLPVAEGFQHWLLKLDGTGKDLARGYRAHYGRIEYAYHLMAADAGIHVMPCRLLEENGRAHFMTQRFDRDGNTKHHVQTLCAISELDFNMIGVHSYNQYFDTIRLLGIGPAALQEGFRRMAFNVIAANCNDQTNNFSFLLREGGKWELAPAHDMSGHFSMFNLAPQSSMSINGKTAHIRHSDLMAVADRFGIPGAGEILRVITQALSGWQGYAKQAGIPEDLAILLESHFQPLAAKAVARPRNK